MAKKQPTRSKRVAQSTASKRSSKGASAKPRLLSGDNPQIAKGYGDAPVQAYIEAIPGWKREIAQRLDALIARAVPDVRKAVKWNSPLYGVDDHTWFLGIHCFTKYVKVAFFRGTSLVPMPPDESKQKEVRYLNIYDPASSGHAVLNDSQFISWVKQASQLPGEKL
jgi:hypothetical protein